MAGRTPKGRIKDTLEEILAYFDDRADCETLMDGTQKPNEEMILADETRKAMVLVME